MIRKEARRVLAAAEGKSGSDGGGGDEDTASAAVEDAGFRLEAAGLHAQRSWFELSLWQFGRRNVQGCARAPFTCGLLGGMPEATQTTVGDIKFSLMKPGTVVR